MKRITVGLALLILVLSAVPSLAAGKPVKAEKEGGGDPVLERIDQALELARKNRRTAEVEIRLIVKDAQETKSSLVFVKTVASSGGGGKTATALPGYCKRPPAPLPEPVPYPEVGDGSEEAKPTKEDLAARAEIAAENTGALLGYLRTLKKQVHSRDNYVSGLTRKNRLARADKDRLEKSLLSIRKRAESVLDEFDRFIGDIQRFRDEHLAAVAGS
jgi:hypothetical protein